ncbi:N-acetylglucosamine 6-phosphate deacetylase [Halobacillus karajensis]|uniref:N-acetylglucosamine-6-phosphate deacetylase n=1 Tax=Halobacillus karajensis TaxID=195088 RepID=A0A024P6X9_9BACI|nr:N-acetylglucosamine-6-phosphate deacetylase [Halobacillus karajensis]CDQ21062.1 N-acetylglucosamine-6-phosphate deacetylase [Halobacillus karajensis]CDQ24874.1 N-acetylglucosamine-6-phosphate deacetylase [Halobacillus karajensis]CDQ28766.1 N-acetylglucosamine-6-phosphate deacetylase [Halobacillus karajensis]SEH96720.1 N-acetylglucosamine 6-phosphate deacetylase [Halobacillus karajensis]
MGDLMITNVSIVTEKETIPNGTVYIKDGTIEKISKEKDRTHATHVIDGKGENLTLVPGFIDVHIHGANGHDVMDATPEALDGLATQLPKEGTTSFLATTMTQSKENISRALKNAGEYIESQKREGKAEVLGVHLEGPFISEEKAGAQPPEHIAKPSLELFHKWQKESENHIKLVTIAPETDGALQFIKEICGKGVVCSLGHSSATLETANEAVKHGASHVTHLFNQMSGLHHREPGLVGAAFTNPELWVEMIVDHIHVHPEAVKLAYRMIGSKRTVLITDAMRAKCLPEGIYDLAGQSVRVQNGEARLEDGTLAGSILTLEEAAQKMQDFVGVNREELVQITSANAARELGVYHRKGSIAEKKDADLVILDEGGNVLVTICKGIISYDKRR